MLETLVRRWQQLQLRERRLIGLGAIALSAMLLYMFAFEPAWAGRQRLAAELPTLRSQLAQMEALAAEARRLSGTAATSDSPQQLRAQIEQSIAAAGLQGSVSQLTQSGELIDLRFKAAPFPQWIGWFDTTLRETRLRAVDVAVSREAAPGTVSARLTLEAPRREQ
jgi:general secretion pathway protein M